MSITPTPDAARWAILKALFEAAFEAPQAQREALIAAAALDAAALVELRSLLAHHDAATGGPAFMVESAAALLNEGAARVGQRLGTWEIVRAVGSGGMGEVFEARRADGSYEGRAAVKLLKRGMDSAAVLQRFAQERQALARLSHPHIARLLDAGASTEGLPYFVLEYVDGRPIDEAVRGLALAARLQLFLQLADAVVYAHRNLLVHRDLKPGNVLVDNEGRVKLLDFGIAKALDPLEQHDGNTTLDGVRPYTPNYASPEQVRGEPVSTATDIYSLGVLLYQMLTGTRPTGRHATTPAEAARSVLEDEPTRPSQLSAAEAADPQWLQTRKKLEGDLDNILLKALAKTATQRYASVDALASDVRAYVEGRPVSARPVSAAYVAVKFVRRHRVGSALAALALVAVLGSSAVAWQQAHRAELARATAEGHLAQLRKLSRDVVVEYGDAITYVPGGMERKATMLTTTLGYLDRLLSEGGDDPAFRGEIGSVYVRLAELQGPGTFNAVDRPDDAVRNARRAVELIENSQPEQRSDPQVYRWWARAHWLLAKGAQQKRDLTQALAHLQTAEGLLTRGLSRFPGQPLLRTSLAETWNLTARVQYGYGLPNLGQPDAALASLERAQTVLAEAVAGVASNGTAPEQAMENQFELANVYAGRALTLARLERWPAAQAAARETLVQRLRASSLEPENRVVQGAAAADHNLLGGLCLNVGDWAGAISHTRAALGGLQTLSKADPTNNAWQTQRRFLSLNHGRALLRTGDARGALVELRVSADWLTPLVASGKASALQRRRLGQTHLAQAEAQHAVGATVEAAVLAQRAAEALAAMVAADATDRDHWLVLGETAAVLSGWTSGAAAQRWRAQARSAYDTAQRLAPLDRGAPTPGPSGRAQSWCGDAPVSRATALCFCASVLLRCRVQCGQVAL